MAASKSPEMFNAPDMCHLGTKRPTHRSAPRSREESESPEKHGTSPGESRDSTDPAEESADEMADRTDAPKKGTSRGIACTSAHDGGFASIGEEAPRR